jgi:small-conductance mechanosensitive channel
MDALENAWDSFVEALPEIALFLLILIVGWILAKAIARILETLLEKIGFDRWVERGGIKRALAKSEYDASDLLSKIVFYGLMLVVLQLAFGVFGNNPVSDLIDGLVAYLPNIFVAILIIVIAAAVAAAVRDITRSALGSLNYGDMLANLAYFAILIVGIFAALDQLDIAPTIVDGLFYALLAIVAGSLIIAIGGGGIQPMRSRWEMWLSRAEEEAPKIAAAAGSDSPSLTAPGTVPSTPPPANDPGSPY